MKDPTPPGEKPPDSPLRFVGIGLEMVVPIVLLIYAGHRLDVWLDREPWFMLGGALIGIVIGFYNLYRAVTPAGDGRSDRKD